jgi:hypothetical protein
VLYKAKNWHYYLLEFCYYGNFIVQITLFFYPESEFFFLSAFAIALGPLCFGCIALNNAIVPHSFDKLTSSYIHIMPPLVMWGLRWKCELGAFAGTNEISIFQYLSAGLVMYFIWLVCYYVKIFSASYAKIEKYQIEMTYKYMM